MKKDEPSLTPMCWMVFEIFIFKWKPEFPFKKHLLIKRLLQYKQLLLLQNRALKYSTKSSIRLYFVFAKILYHKRLSSFIVKEIGRLKADQGDRMYTKCHIDRHAGAINHKISGCETYIRHFGWSQSTLWWRFWRQEFLLLKLVGAIKLGEPSFCTSSWCSTAFDSCLVTNRKTWYEKKYRSW